MLVLRANQVWAPFPDHDAEGARGYMCQFYALVTKRNGETFDVAEAARLEVDWWPIHRNLQRESSDGSVTTVDDLTEAVALHYALVYEVPIERVRSAAAHRAYAMVISDAWVTDGAHAGSPAIAKERDELVAGYTLLREAVGG